MEEAGETHLGRGGMGTVTLKGLAVAVKTANQTGDADMDKAVSSKCSCQIALEMKCMLAAICSRCSCSLLTPE